MKSDNSTPAGSWCEPGSQEGKKDRDAIPVALTYHSEPESDVETSSPSDGEETQPLEKASQPAQSMAGQPAGGSESPAEVESTLAGVVVDDSDER